MAKKQARTSETETLAKLNRDNYNRVVASAKLMAIQVASASFDVKAEYYDPDVKKNLNIERTDMGAVFDEEEGTTVGRFQFCCSAKSGNRYVLKAVAEYLVIYDVGADADPDAAKAFCSRVGEFAAYPYFRSLVAHLAWEANAKLPPLPVIATRGSPIAATSPPKSEPVDS